MCVPTVFFTIAVVASLLSLFASFMAYRARKALNMNLWSPAAYNDAARKYMASRSKD